MRFSFSWLKMFLNTSATSTEIAAKLTDLGLEVESVQDERKIYEDFKVVFVEKVLPHPGADKLKVCLVVCGENESLEIVCGAPNVREGMLAVLAPVGAVLPGTTIKMKAAQIRGVTSLGMLCSAKELGLSEESSGILELANGKPGQSLSDLSGFGDCFFDVSVTPNRADCFGVYGIARDLAAGGMGTLKPLWEGDEEVESGKHQSREQKLIMELGDRPTVCPQFGLCGMIGVENKESPSWLKECLRSAGAEPISALVDVSNFLSYSFGRPIHIYDADKVNGQLIVRFAHENESFEALTGKTYVLTKDMVVIADEKGVCSLGGIMGGMDTRCVPQTQSILIESAWFDPIIMSQTGQKLSLLSEARARMERGVDPESIWFGLSLAVRLIKEICGGRITFADVVGAPLQSQPVEVRWDEKLYTRLTGLTLPENEGLTILTRLGFTPVGGGRVRVPSWRFDIKLPEDLVEEVLRIKGFDSIQEKKLHHPRVRERGLEEDRQRKIFSMKHIMAQSGLSEIMTYAFISPHEANLFGMNESTPLLENPLSPELSVMRPSLIPGLLKALAKNNSHGTMDVGVFEVGSVYVHPEEPWEELFVAGVLRGKATPLDWRGSSRAYDFLDAKEKALTLLKAWEIDERGIVLDRENIPSWFHPHETGRLALRGSTSGQGTLGFFGTLHPEIVEKLDLSGGDPIACFEITVDGLSRLKKKKPLGVFNPSPFPKVTRDFSFLMDKTQEVGPVIERIKNLGSPLIQDVRVFDIYQGKNVQHTQKAIAFRVWMSSLDKTLTDAEITSLCAEITAVCEQSELVLRA